MIIHEKYTLPTKIELELAELPDPASPDYLSQLECASIEVVVIARRHSEDLRLRDHIDSILVERTPRLIRAAVRKHSHVPWEEIDEAEDEAMVMFWEQIQDESFFEIRFNSAMMTLAHDAGKKILGGKQRKRERFAVRITSAELGGTDGRNSVADIAEYFDSDSIVDSQHLVEIGLAALSKEQARALILHHQMGYQIYSDDPTVVTVATLLGCKERKARKLIADGRATFQCAIGQENVNE